VYQSYARSNPASRWTSIQRVQAVQLFPVACRKPKHWPPPTSAYQTFFSKADSPVASRDYPGAASADDSPLNRPLANAIVEAEKAVTAVCRAAPIQRALSAWQGLREPVDASSDQVLC